MYSTFLQSCGILLIQIGGHAVMYWSTVGHTVSRDVNLQARVHQAWTFLCSEISSHGLAFPVWHIRIRMNGSQWNEKPSVTAALHCKILNAKIILED